MTLDQLIHFLESGSPMLVKEVNDILVGLADRLDRMERAITALAEDPGQPFASAAKARQELSA